MKYWDDFDNHKEYEEKVLTFLDKLEFYEGDLKCKKYDVFNSVYHIQPIKNNFFRMPLHKLAPYLASIGVQVEYHNWTSEGVNICFDIKEIKDGINHQDKDNTLL